MYNLQIAFALLICIEIGILPTDADPVPCRGVIHRPVIIGGTPAPEGTHPHMAGLTMGTRFRDLFCGGSILTARTVLTAAHCIDAAYFDGELDSTLGVIVGTNQWKEGYTLYQISYNITHPNYNPGTVLNDIGILVTSTNIVFTDLVQPISLNYDYQDQGIPVRVAGWGSTTTGGKVSKNLMEVVVITIDGEQCVIDVANAAKEFNTTASPIDPNSQICTVHSPGYGACNGDSGSCLARTDNCQMIGIVSWGFPCARGAPDVFTRVSAYKEWLQSVIV